MGLQEELDAVRADMKREMPDIAARLDADTEELVRRGVGTTAPGVGETAPDFELPDQVGRMVRSAELRQKGVLVVSFYRGHWCPYCSLELRSLRQHLSRITELGGSLVAVSPQIPDESLTTAEKNELAFPVLSDVGNAVARKFGLVFVLPGHLRPIYANLGIDLPKFNGTDTFELPVPATFVIDRDAVIRAAHVNADYKQRMEPARILKVLAGLKR